LPILFFFFRPYSFHMSKQYNKLIKRRRRAAYLARRKKALTETTPKKVAAKAKPVKKATKSVPKKPAAKEETTSAAAEVKSSDVATTEDVLGPDTGAPEAAKTEGAPASEAE
jgi:hypothetical protein